MSGWIKLHRTMLEWEWYDDINVCRLFIHFLLKANHTPKKWKGMEIGRGQFWTSLDSLESETNLSRKQIRVAIDKLISTNDVASKGQARGRMVTVINYDMYQEEGKLKGKEGAGSGQAEGKLGATTKNDKNEDNEKNKDKAKAKRFVPVYSDWNNWDWPTQPDEDVFDSWLTARKKIKGGISELSFKRLGKEFCKATNLNDCLAEMELRGWKGFKSDWMQNNSGASNGQHQQNSRSMSAVDKVREATEQWAKDRGTGSEAGCSDDSVVATYDRNIRS